MLPQISYRPQSVPTSYANANYEYYGAAKVRQLSLSQSEAFPKSRSEVEGLPRGVNVASARKAYLSEEQRTKGI